MFRPSDDVLSERIYFEEMGSVPTPNPEDDFPLFFEFEQERDNLWERLFQFPFVLSSVIKILENILKREQSPYRLFKQGGRKTFCPPTSAVENALAQLRCLRLQLSMVHYGIPTLGFSSTMLVPIGKAGSMVFASMKFGPNYQARLSSTSSTAITARANDGNEDEDEALDEVLTIQRRFITSASLELQRSAKAILALRNHIAERHLRLVVCIVNEYGFRCMDRLDLISEGNIGLMKAIDRFEPHRGLHFSTFAVHWIRQAVTSALKNQSRTIRIPVHQFGKMHKVERTIHALLEEGVLPPIPPTLIAERSGLSLAAVHMALRLPMAIRLRDRGDREGDGEEPLTATIPDVTAMPIEDIVNQAMLHDRLLPLLDEHLTERERDIVYRYFGVNGFTQHNLDQLAKRYSLTREGVRQIKERALKKARRPCTAFQE